MPDSTGHHRRFKAGREVKVSTAYLGGLVVSEKKNTVLLLQVPIPQEQRDELQEVR